MLTGDVCVSADSTNAAAAVAQAAIQKTQAVKHYHKQVSCTIKPSLLAYPNVYYGNPYVL